MIREVIKRFLTLTLCVLMLCAVMPINAVKAYAATSLAVPVADLGVEYDEGDTIKWWFNVDKITGTVEATTGCSTSAATTTLTLTNQKTVAATLAFDYEVSIVGGTITVDNNDVTANGSFSKTIDAGDNIKIILQSSSTANQTTKIVLKNIQLYNPEAIAAVTFLPAAGGGYTIDGEEIAEKTTKENPAAHGYEMVATPDTGYRFFGWFSGETKISANSKTIMHFDKNTNITAKFVDASLPIFEVQKEQFLDLNEAVEYAASDAVKEKTIVLVDDGTLKGGDYTIPSGVTLLIPFDEAGTLYTDKPEVIRTIPTSKAFRTLDMAEGASITVEGAISLAGSYYAAGGSAQGRSVGNYGYIKMENGSSITVKDGGSLYAWGFISGNGTILAESGAAVYEFYQIADFRGGSASSAMSNKVFPFSQYFVQNIEVPLTLNAGANEKVYSGVYALSSTYTTTINFIGDNGMFNVASGSFTKDYDEKTDRLILTVNGEAALNTLALKLAGQNVDSAEYVLPITNNISINIQSGEVTINQDAALLAGAEVNIAEGADLIVASGKSAYIYDEDEWNSDNFVCGPSKFKSVAYAPGKAYNRSSKDLVDAKVDVNGNVTVIGAIYTTAGGAHIGSSEGSGTYQQNGEMGTENVTYQYTQSGSSVTACEIPITPAKLHNADGSYEETAKAKAGDIIPYKDGKWERKVKVEFNLNGVDGSLDEQVTIAGTTITLPENTFTREGYDFVGWNTKADGTGIAYTDQATISVDEYVTLYAQWEAKKYTITWLDEDGKLLKTTEAAYDTVPEFGDENPTKAEKSRYSYTFEGWIPEVTTVTGDATYTAKYTETGKNGLCIEGEDTYWIKDGVNVEYPGLQKVQDADGHNLYYYFGEDGKAVKNVPRDGKDYWVEKTNGLLPQWGYYFDENGVILHDDAFQNGIQEDDYYYIDGIKVHQGLFEEEENYYYARRDGKLVKDQWYYCERMNGLYPEGNYHFDADGKMFTGSGIVEEDGSLYYYVNGLRTYAGLIEIDGSYYYVKTNGEVVHGKNYWITKTNGLMQEKSYTFDADGKMTNPSELKDSTKADGIDLSDMCYYKDGLKYYAGLIEIDGAYYYVRTSGEVVHGQKYWITKTNGLMKESSYTFADDGKMIL